MITRWILGLVLAACRRSAPVESNAAPTEYVELPGVGLRMLRPDGFERATNFDGIQQDTTHTSVHALRMAAPYAQTSAAFTAEGMAAQGLTLLTHEDHPIDGRTGIVVHFLQSAQGATIEKWALIFGDAESTTMVTASYPKDNAERVSEVTKAVVLGVVPTGEPMPDPSELVDFTLAPSDLLKLGTGMSGGLSYTKDGTIGAVAASDPLFVAGHSVASVQVSDHDGYAAVRLARVAMVEVTTIPPATPVTVDGLDGVELVAPARHPESGTPIVVYQLMLFDDAGYYLMVGIVGEESKDVYLPEFRRLGQSFARKPR